MQAPEISFYDWQRQFLSEEACLRQLIRLRWPNGFQRLECGHNQGFSLKERRLHENALIESHQPSVTAGTLFHATKLPLTKWFWSIY